MSNENFDIIPEWVIDFTKGGPGSGEHAGHPFRGNKWTSETFAAGAHNLRAGTEHFSASQNIDAANAHTNAAMAALHSGQFGIAHTHLNEAAYHFAQAAVKGGGTIHQQASSLYGLAHHAGDVNELASKATNDLARAVRAGADQQTIALLASHATAASSAAHSAANDVFSHMNTMQSGRMAGAMDGAATRAALAG